MSSDYEKFLEHMKKEEKEDTPKSPSLSIGMKDEKGSLLLLGGRKSRLWQLHSGEYAVGNLRTNNTVVAMQAYNVANGTGQALDYITQQFLPWYKRQTKLILTVPSSRPGYPPYHVRRESDGRLTCECLGFIHYGYCWHIDAVKEYENAHRK